MAASVRLSRGRPGPQSWSPGPFLHEHPGDGLSQLLAAQVQPKPLPEGAKGERRVPEIENGRLLRSAGAGAGAEAGAGAGARSRAPSSPSATGTGWGEVQGAPPGKGWRWGRAEKWFSCESRDSSCHQGGGGGGNRSSPSPALSAESKQAVRPRRPALKTQPSRASAPWPLPAASCLFMAHHTAPSYFHKCQLPRLHIWVTKVPEGYYDYQAPHPSRGATTITTTSRRKEEKGLLLHAALGKTPTDGDPGPR